jgi:hypothetical protein
MEQDFYRDELEQMLRETSDKFKMYPSSKVWSSIYNDLNPGNKWPSLTVLLLFILAFVYIDTNKKFTKSPINPSSGFSATNTGLIVNPGKPSRFGYWHPIERCSSGFSSSIMAVAQDQTAHLYSNRGVPKVFDTQKKLIKLSMRGYSASKSQLFSPFKQALNERKARNQTCEIFNPKSSIASVDMFYSDISESTILNLIDVGSANISTSQGYYMPDTSTAAASLEKSLQTSSSIPMGASEAGIFGLAVEKISKVNKPLRFSVTAPDEDKAWIEDFVLHHHVKRSKWRSNLSLQYHISPSVGYRILYKNSDFKPTNGLLLRSVDNSMVLNQQAALNTEAGASVILQLRKNIRLKAGIQLNYNNYITHAHELSHPVQTSVLLNDLHNGNLMSSAYTSTYGNILGSNFSRLNNRTIQLSLPIGFDYKILGNDRLKWYFGASVQPSFVSSGNAYLVSSDYKYFVDDPSMIRKWNINTGVETFASIKINDLFHFNIGPQFRYQLLSTYSKEYTFSEKLYNVGLKFGMTKNL